MRLEWNPSIPYIAVAIVVALLVLATHGFWATVVTIARVCVWFGRKWIDLGNVIDAACVARLTIRHEPIELQSQSILRDRAAARRKRPVAVEA